jgi:alpha-glucosidase
VVFSNHDQPRVVAKWGEARDPDEVARLAALLLLTLRGTPFLYYGEELGVPGIVVADEDAIDPPAHRVAPDFPWWNRDQARAPMPWDGGPAAGFTKGRPWLPLPPDAARRNVAAQRSDPASVLAFYRRLLALRRATPPLRRGGFRRLASSAAGVLAFVRSTADEGTLVVANFGDRGTTTTLAATGGGTRWRPVLSTHDRSAGELRDGGRLRLAPLEGAILASGR